MPPTSLDTPAIRLDVVALIANASWPVQATVGLLLFASLFLWCVAVLKYLQLARSRAACARFERSARPLLERARLSDLADNASDSAAARVLDELCTRGAGAGTERLRAIADRAILDERQRARSLLSPLATIGAAAPFVGLFGTVYGIMDAFMRIAAAKTAALPVVAPAIGEALVTTAIGLAVAIPAVVFFNMLDKRASDLVALLEAVVAEWIPLVAEPASSEAIPLVQGARSAFGTRR